MPTTDAIFWVTGLGGWLIIAAIVIALVGVLFGYLRQATTVVRNEGWPALWKLIRVHILTRKPRKRL